MDEDAPKKRFELTLAVETYAFLEALKKLGTHGSTARAVARTLIEMGIRDAIERGYLKLKDE